MAANGGCKQCKMPLHKGASSIGCEGFCSKFFHLECINFSFDDLICYRKPKNVWWICEECRIVMQEVKNSRSTSNVTTEIDSNPAYTHAKIDKLDNEVAALKDQLAEIHQTLADVSSVHTTGVPDAVQVDVPQAHSSVLSSSQLRYGTRKCSAHASVDLVATGGKYWIFLTKIKNSVTERDILHMVNECLGTDEAVVRKLVPAWRDISSMPFISFKVGIGVKFKDAAQCPSTWPTGLCFREFRENGWEPPQYDLRCT